MALRARDLYATIQHALGGGQHSKELSEIDIANEALEQVASMHGWSFLDHGEAYVDIRGSIAFSAFSWTASTKTLSDPTPSALFASYTAQPGDLVYISAGATASYHKVASRPSDDSLVLETSIASGNLSGTVGGTLEARTAVLPSDFRKLISVQFDTDNSVIADIEIASAQTVARWQSKSPTSLSKFYACAERVVLSTGETRHLLRIAPASGTSTASALLVTYERRIPELTSDNDVVRVPEYLYTLTKQVARALARGLEMPRTWGSFEEQMAEILSGTTFELAKRADDGLGEEIGHIRGGHIPQRQSALDGAFLGHNISIGGPS